MCSIRGRRKNCWMRFVRVDEGAAGLNPRRRRGRLKAMAQSGSAKMLKVVCAAGVLMGLPRLIAQQVDAATLIQRIDAANQARYDNVTGFADTEHYSVFRGNDTHPAAEMVVRVTYRKGEGKSYEVRSRSGSGLIQKLALDPLLRNEKEINEPGRVQASWFTSANYEMRPHPEQARQVNGRGCVVVDITPKHKAPNMIEGTLCVDPRDGTLVEMDGVASKSPNPLAGTTHMMRQYRNIEGYAMATHARAESDSAIVGRTVVVVDYSEYELKSRTPSNRDASAAPGKPPPR